MMQFILMENQFWGYLDRLFVNCFSKGKFVKHKLDF